MGAKKAYLSIRMGHYYNGDVRFLPKVANNWCNYYINYCCQCSDHVNAIITMLLINVIIVLICGTQVLVEHINFIL